MGRAERVGYRVSSVRCEWAVRGRRRKTEDGGRKAEEGWQKAGGYHPGIIQLARDGWGVMMRARL